MFSTLLVLALIASVIAFWQWQNSQSSQRTAIARSLVALADQVRERDPRRALQLGVAVRQLDSARKPRRASGRPSPQPPASRLSAANLASSHR